MPCFKLKIGGLLNKIVLFIKYISKPKGYCLTIFHRDPHNRLKVRNTFFIFSIPTASTVDLMVTRIGPERPTSNSKGAIRPINYTIKSTVAATGMGGKMKST